MKRKFDRIIVVAFDGLDHKKIDKYDLKSVKQEEFGRIYLSDMPLTTGPLWSSFITGKFPEEHGVVKTMNWTHSGVQRIENIIDDNPLFDIWKGVRWTIYRNLDSLDAEVVGAYKENLEADSTIFDDFEPSISINVPGFDLNTALSSIIISRALGEDPPLSKEVMERDIDAEHLKRKEETFEMLESEDFALMMSHFHKSDFIQHLYGFSEEKEEELYLEMEELAKRILDFAGPEDLVVFCSDHGLDEGGHRREAFYSLSHKLGWEDPHITEIRSLLNNLEIRKSENLQELEF